MSNVSMTEVSMVKCLLNMPYEIVFQVFRRLPKGRLLELSKLSSKFENIAGDARLWKDVHIEYKPFKEPPHEIFDFEELYSGPCPVKVINLSEAKVDPPVSAQIGRVIKVTTLCLTYINADKITIEAILAKYQCTELNLHLSTLDDTGETWITEIAPETFSKQTALEVLSLSKSIAFPFSSDVYIEVGLWLREVLSYCKNLITLKLSNTHLPESAMACFLKNLPTSLEKLFLAGTYSDDSVFDLLVKSHPNLKELELSLGTEKCPSLHKFQFLEALHFALHFTCMGHFMTDITNFYMHLTKFTALKVVYILLYFDPNSQERKFFEEVRSTLERHGITLSIRIATPGYGPEPDCINFAESNHWIVSKADL